MIIGPGMDGVGTMRDAQCPRKVNDQKTGAILLNISLISDTGISHINRNNQLRAQHSK
jgi:hypothetical protein